MIKNLKTENDYLQKQIQSIKSEIVKQKISTNTEETESIK